MGVSFYSEDFDQEFGNFGRAMLTMFQIMSFDSWCSGITRPIINHYNDGIRSPLFFISYVFASAIVMSNVVLAILIDKFLASAQEFEELEEENASDGNDLNSE